MRKGDIFALLAFVVLLVACLVLGGCAGLQNSGYPMPEGCEGGFVNNLPTGTDIGTQIVIFEVARNVEGAKSHIEKALKDMKIFLNGGSITRLSFIQKAVSEVDWINENLGPETVLLSKWLKMPGWQSEEILDYCDLHRLNYWIDENLFNLELIKS